MKKIITILFVFLTITLSNAQNDCETYIDFMTESIENYNTNKAKEEMKAFIACKEESLGSDNPIIDTLNEIDYFLTNFVDGKIIAKSKNNYCLVLDFHLKTLNKINYPFATHLNNGFVIVSDEIYSKKGLVTLEGKVVLAVIYDEIINTNPIFAKLNRKNSVGEIDNEYYFFKSNGTAPPLNCVSVTYGTYNTISSFVTTPPSLP